MNNINIEGQNDSPRVILDSDIGLIEIDGKSYPEDAFDFYEPIIGWLKEYFDGVTQSKTTINIKLIYFNSATSQIIFDILDIVNNGNSDNLEINWFYDSNNEDAFEDYEDISEEYPKLKINAVTF